MSSPRVAAATRPGTRWGYLVVGWCVVFASLHAYWALGGRVGLAESAGVDLATRRPPGFVVLGLWGVATLLLVGAVVGRSSALGRHRHRRSRQVVLMAVGTLLLARGALVEIVLLVDADGIATSVGHAQTRWSLLLWNPWFVLGGAAFVLTATGSPPTRSADRRHDGDRRADQGVAP